MSAPTENQFWKLRFKHGRDKLFESPELLWEAACEYFQWCDENPLYERKAFAFQGIITTEDLPKMRAYTLGGLCLYLGINRGYFSDIKQLSLQDFSEVITRVEAVIYNQQFTGAAADLLNANIIARSLGLTDKQEVKSEIRLGKDLADEIYE